MSQSIQKIGIIGLGAMGMGIARALIRAGIPTYGFDLNQKACDQLLQAGAKAATNNAANWASELDAILLVVVNGAQIESILFEGETPLVNQLKAGTIIVLHSTVAAEQAKDFAHRLSQHNLNMLDAPISGGALKAEQGQLTVMASGEPALFEQLKPVFDATTERLYHVGNEIGQGSTVKTIHQLLAGIHIAAAAESMALAAKAGISLELMYDIVTHAAGNSWMFENRVPHILAGDYTAKSSVDIFVKDLRLVLETGRDLKLPLPLSATAHQMFLTASNEGFGQWDDSAVIKTFKGITLPEKK
ncbi:NAD-binding protein [Photorhabdus laumondii subsp. laumondii]|uniref:L-threonate dehydrogenase n=3 Tax=Photorhabdus laumondii TaxID=2218628 RepID=Q7N447_PHOLL|nr:MULTISPECIES: L-threonate dehydrogenase [Photorhabdus]AWK42254.1 oxidoreductase [Photorhabdus laumondii subsp. laumondii]AXG43103.1 NAD(P)-dependent oxidoreductase [Photorhabdus laumondii subsp. laumondii]AXG47574.1 NAD(P)-dependent oxidoreductase [Photorhabdus laumondii subsp. laumondii]KTL62889.1 oxidoreductase [Photorhabdus laumondii subsp. laumondii]MCC8385009.1 NAD(P)-dependent oxidoreductase [Photorhabdus laumondii]